MGKTYKNMSQSEIKVEKQRLFNIIKDTNKKLDELRVACQHHSQEDCMWSWRIGCFDPAIICSDCGEFIKYKNPIPQLLDEEIEEFTIVSI